MSKEFQEWFIQKEEDRKFRPWFEKGVPTVAFLISACKEVLGEDVKELEVFDNNDIEGALGVCFSLLIEKGIDNPEEFLKEKGVLE